MLQTSGAKEPIRSPEISGSTHSRPYVTGPIQHRRTTTVLSFSETIDANLSGIRLAIYRKVDEKYIISKYQNERMHALKCLY